MIVVVFSDVHANVLALDAFLAQVEGRVDVYLCLGDSVNYGPSNDECLERILGLPNITMLEGNHERLFRDEEVGEEIPLVQAFFEASRASFRRPDLIEDLPVSVELGSFLCIHTIDGRRVFADTDIYVSRDHLIGHSHHQYLVHRGGDTIVDPAASVRTGTGSITSNTRFTTQSGRPSRSCPFRRHHAFHRRARGVCVPTHRHRVLRRQARGGACSAGTS